MKNTLRMFMFFVGSVVTYSIHVAYGIYPSPLWGGEAFISLAYISISILPSAILTAISIKHLNWITSGLIGVMSVLLIMPLTLLTRLTIDALQLNNYIWLFIIYGLAQVIFFTLAIKLINYFKKRIKE